MFAKVTALIGTSLLCSQAAFGLFGYYSTVIIREGDQAPGLPLGNTVTSLFLPPSIRGKKVAFVTERAGPNTGPGGQDQAVYLADLQTIANIFLLNDSDVAPVNAMPGSVIEGFRYAAPTSAQGGGVSVSLAGAGGSRIAFLSSTNSTSSVVLDSNTAIPNSGGRTFKSIDDVTFSDNPAQALFGGSLNSPSEIGNRFSILATSATGVHVAAQPGMALTPLHGSACTIDAVSGSLLGPAPSGSRAYGLVWGLAKTSGSEFGVFTMRVDWVDTETPTATAIAGPMPASPPALSAGTVLFFSQVGAGTGNRAAITMTIDRPGMSQSEETAVLDLSTPDPWSSATRLLPPSAPVLQSPSTAGFVPSGTVVAGHSSRMYFSTNRFYGNLTVRRPDNQTRIAFASMDTMPRRHTGATQSLASEAKALLLTQAPAPSLSGPTISSINKINTSEDGYALVEVTLAGTGVVSSNNTAWYLCSPDDEVVLVLRKGQNLEISPGVTKTLNAVSYFYNAGAGDGRPNSLGTQGAWVFQASLAGFSTTALFAIQVNPQCPADLNGDGQVDDADFVVFVEAYNILDCADPAMPAGCPADLNGDSLVADADFVVFVAAYNELVCP